MSDRRSPPEDVSPLTEDWGIFKNAVVTVQLSLTPLRKETSRGDLLFIADLDGARVEVVFPGRRRKDAVALEAELDHFQRQEARIARSKGAPPPHSANLRFPLRADGTWRTRLVETDQDEWQRVYQFLAASWSYNDQYGEEAVFGDLPLKRPAARTSAI